jgi:hypothetical protein
MTLQDIKAYKLQFKFKFTEFSWKINVSKKEKLKNILKLIQNNKKVLQQNWNFIKESVNFPLKYLFEWNDYSLVHELIIWKFEFCSIIFLFIE